MSNEAVVKGVGITRSLRMGGQDLQILRGVSLEVTAGEWVAISGPSGSGKSTLLGVLAGIDQPTRGQVWIDGIETSALPESKLARLRNEKIGIVFQGFHLIPMMTALENVEAPLYIGRYRRQARGRAEEMLGKVGLSNRMGHQPHQLSGGEQQRVAIARALVTEPRLLLADEPTGNLDSAASLQIMTLVQRLREELSLTVIMVTHDPRIAAAADRSLHMLDGKLADPQAGADKVSNFVGVLA